MPCESPVLDAKVSPLERVVVAERADHALVDDLPTFHHVDAIGDGERQSQVLLCDQDRHTYLSSQPADQLRKAAHHLRRQAFGGFVQEQETRARHQRPSDREHLLLAAGQSAPRAGRAQRQNLEQRENLGQVTPAGRQSQVLSHAQGAEDATALRDQGQAPARDPVGG